MEIEKLSSGDLLEMKLRGSFDHVASVHFRESVEESTRAGWHRMLIDLGDVDYISSAGLGALVSAKKKLLSLNGQFGAHNPTSPVAKVLELTKLFKILIVAPDDFQNAETTATITIDGNSKRFSRAHGIDMELYTLSETASMSCSIIGDTKVLQDPENGNLTASRVQFEQGSIGLGVGMLSSQTKPDVIRYGEIISIAGAVAQSAPDSGLLPDYSLARGEFTPSADLLYGVKLDGQFSNLVRFQSSDPEASIQLSNLVRACMEELNCLVAGFAILTDCTGLLGAQMKRWDLSESDEDPFSIPKIRDWISFSPEHSHEHKLALIVGVATLEHEAVPSGLQDFLRPLKENPNQTGHFHAAVFPYRPLKKRTINLQAFVDDLFDTSEIQEVMHLLRDTRPNTGETESELKSGACWVEPIDASQISEVQQ